MSTSKLFLGNVCHLIDDPLSAGESALQSWTNGALIVRDGRIVAVGAVDDLTTGETTADLEVVDCRGQFIVPGFIDSHLHFPQAEMIGSHGAQLLEWLQKYTFPAELEFGEAEYAAAAAEVFLDELLKNGTTTALVYATVHQHSADSLFTAAARRDLRLVTGKVMMDRNCPPDLRDTAHQGYEESLALIEKWHGRQRLSYAVTPRFAPTSSDDQLQLAGELFASVDGLYLQSHVAENRAEVEWVAELFPKSRSYLDVYDHFGLLGQRAVYGHCIYLDDTDRKRMRETGSVIAFCPTSNLFLGSGLFDYLQAREQGVATSLATDVGGGTSFSMLKTAEQAYKVTQLLGGGVDPLSLFYEMTLGAARSLSMDQSIGNFGVGKEADFIVLDGADNPLLARRLERAQSTAEQLFALMVLGDDRCTASTYVLGECRYRRN